MRCTLHQPSHATNWHSNKLGEANILGAEGDTDVCDEPSHVAINVQIILQIGVVQGKL